MKGNFKTQRSFWIAWSYAKC